ncbi:glycosyltransferase [Halomonas elongata]|uniref:Glycosyltransferase n=1 Tax=Halomonas elongata (strain ATCC 33173 / DSM 2581 / NBRC 15536 / NCIMB 2198 / 1H9) TaxID=768066 RepID=E1VC09_HALED|nr:glycosyltransferase [Halomonas elongata]WBF19551.1 glycosyltransferase [Halomonas elongata]WPU48415.1 glycosyltransferase [Halomonas elongata DSM 2581]CBV42279.1 glycosyltransferase domain protein [Halomonas elongata DSM 2581]
MEHEQCIAASVIVPLRAKEIEQREILRLTRLLETIPSGFEVIIVDDGSEPVVRRHIRHIVEQRTLRGQVVRGVYLRTRHRRFSLARARNRGALAARSPVVIFHDVDFLALTEVYRRLLEHIHRVELATRPEHFFCVPVAFLTQDGTEHFLEHFEDSKEAWCFRNRDNHPHERMNFLVQGSSCIVTNRADLLAMGGHDEGFKGHGAEDFELLHRLSSLYPIAPRPPEYTRNMGSGPITEYRGFRAYFALYGEECRQQGCTLVHLWHPKRTEKGYYRHKQNFKRLQALMDKDVGRVCSLTYSDRPQIDPRRLLEVN